MSSSSRNRLINEYETEEEEREREFGVTKKER